MAAHPNVKIVAVAGSIGKSTTRRAVAGVLSQRYRVRMHEPHRKTAFHLPAEILGISLPEKPTLFQWIAALRAAGERVRAEADTDIIIQEINTIRPGDFAAVGRYLHPDITLLTGVTAEQIEVFGSVEAVGQEYMSLTGFSKYALINRDDIDAKFAQLGTNPNFSTYGSSGTAEYRFETDSFDLLEGYKGVLVGLERDPCKLHIRVVGDHMLRAAIAAYAVAVRIGMEDDDIVRGLEALRPLSGRMNPLRGIDGTTIIDDTHDARPASVAAALQTLYALDTEDVPQRIAVLGDIQNLGNLSKEEHEKLGALCDPSLVTWFVLVGPEMEMYLAPVAKSRGCQVRVVRNAIEAGKFVRSVTETGTVILVAGAASLYLEETVKTLCNMTEDTELVRQTPEFMAKKNAFFNLFQ